MPTQPVLTGIITDPPGNTDPLYYYSRDATPTLVGTADPNATVYLYYSDFKNYYGFDISGSAPVHYATTVASSSGSWSFTTPVLTNARHEIGLSSSGQEGSYRVASLIAVDTIPPSVYVFEIDRQFRGAGNIYIDVDFNENADYDPSAESSQVDGVDIGNFTLQATGFPNATIQRVGREILGRGYVVAIATGSTTTNGTVQLTIHAAGITDFAGNPLAADATSQVFPVVNDEPPVATISQNGPESAKLVHYAVAFSKDVTGFGPGDLTFTGSGITGVAVQSITATDASHYDVAVSTGTGYGSFTLGIVAAQAGIRDAVGTNIEANAFAPTYVNEPPVAEPDALAATVLHESTGNVFSNDQNLDNATHVVTLSAADSSTATPVGTAGSTAVQGRYGVLRITDGGSYAYLATDASTLPTGTTVHDVFEYAITDNRGSTSTASLDVALSRATTQGSSPTVQAGKAFLVDGSLGVQTLIGTDATSFINTATAAGLGSVVVDLPNGYVTVGGAVDALLQNIHGVQLGADPSTVLGLTAGTDLIYGGQGALTVQGQGATDYIQGGTGTNSVVGGSGNTIFYSNGGQDTMQGGTGQSFMQAGPTAGSVDIFYGGGGKDFVYGGAGSTRLVGSSGTEVLTGGSGYSELTGSNTATGALNVFNGGPGADVFYAGVGTNLLYEATGTDVFAGSSGSDYVYGGAGRSFIYAGSGTTAVTTGAANQYVQAGSGHLFFNDTSAGLHAGRYDQIDNFAGSGGVDLYLPTAVQGTTGFVAGDGGAAVVTAVDGGTATLFASGADVATLQAHTHFTLT